MIYHFIGIGGIGMSALARILLQRGEQVQGSDAARSPLLEALEKEGAKICIGHREESIASGMTVIYSTDIKETNVEWMKAKQLGLPLLHRSEMLDRLIEGKKGLLITGTHGKTTTTALLAETLSEAKKDPSFVIGGILRSQNTNGKEGRGEYFVAEADESDGSFLKSPSFGAIVTNLENEHLNYWRTTEALDEGFSQFFQRVENRQHLFWCGDDPRLISLKPEGISYGFSEKAQLQIRNYQPTDGGISFDLLWKGRLFQTVELSLLGRHNALNGAAVFGLAQSLGVDEEAVRRSFRNFSGTRRRLEKKGEAGGIVVYDDYGHHPTEIAATVKALRDGVGQRRLCVVFQPHRYSRVRDLFDEFLSCFQDADRVILTDIYSAGEAPIEGVSTKLLKEGLSKKWGEKLLYLPRNGLEEAIALQALPSDVILTIGAGDVTRVGEPLLNILRRNSA